MILHVVLPSGSHAKIGTFRLMSKDVIQRYITKYPLSWIEI